MPCLCDQPTCLTCRRQKELAKQLLDTQTWMLLRERLVNSLEVEPSAVLEAFLDENWQQVPRQTEVAKLVNENQRLKARVEGLEKMLFNKEPK